MTLYLSCGNCKTVRSFSGTPPTCEVCGWVCSTTNMRAFAQILGAFVLFSPNFPRKYVDGEKLRNTDTTVDWATRLARIQTGICRAVYILCWLCDDCGRSDGAVVAERTPSIISGKTSSARCRRYWLFVLMRLPQASQPGVTMLSPPKAIETPLSKKSPTHDAVIQPVLREEFLLCP
jgi:hypothetical protein